MSDTPKIDPIEESGRVAIAVEEEAPPRKTERRATPKGKTKTKKQPNYHVIIWNDEEHTYEYVIELLMRICAHSFEAACAGKLEVTPLVE